MKEFHPIRDTFKRTQKALKDMEEQDPLFHGDPTQEKLEDLIRNKVPESARLEFKSGDTLRNSEIKDIVKEVCAIANTNGGWLVLGLKDQKEEGTMGQDQEDALPVRMDPVQEEKQGWLEDILSSNLLPSVHGLNVLPVEIEGGPSGYVYVVEVPESLSSPHMSGKTKKYYHRQGSTSADMEEHLVRAAYFKSQTAELEIEPILGITPRSNGGGGNNDINQLDFGLSVIVRNTGNVREDAYKVQVELPWGLHIGGRRQSISWHNKPVEGETTYLGYLAQNITYLFPGESTKFDLSLEPLYSKNNDQIQVLLEKDLFAGVFFSGGYIERAISIKEAIEGELKEEFTGLPHPRS